MEIIKLNLIPSGVNPVCHCSQYDNGRVIRIELFEGLTPYALASGDVVTLNVRKPDNTIVTATVTTTQGNTYVDIVTTEQICACVGNNLCDLTITNGSVVIGTLNFIMQVERDVLADGIPSQSAIEDLDAQINAIIGNQINAINDNLGDIDNTLDIFNSQNELDFINHPSLNYAGITAVYDGRKYILNGTASAAINFNIWVNASGLPHNIKTGDLITWRVKRSNTNIVLRRLTQTTTRQSWGDEDWISSFAATNNDGYYQEIIPNDVTGWLIRITLVQGVQLNNDTISFEIARYLPNSITEQGCPIIASITGTISAAKHTALIQDALSKFGAVILAKGYHYVNNLTMPDNTTLKGLGNGSILKTTDSSAHGVIVGSWCNIDNLKIEGTRSASSSSATTEAGILIEGNYESTPLRRNIKITNCFIQGFGAGGIVGRKTGYWVADSISATNCEITKCYAGIRLEDFCEFNRFTNILSYANYCGLLCYSGNNVFVNCSFSNNTVGVYLIGDSADLSGNNGHGTLVGCTINHSDNNNGFGILVKGISGNGFIFDSCQVWYGKVQVESSVGIVINNCIFGALNANTEFINWDSSLFLLNNLFKVGATFTGNGTNTKANNYKFDGTPIT